MARDYGRELTEVRNALATMTEAGGVVQMRIGDQSYTMSRQQLENREQYLLTKIRIRAGGGRSIIGEVTL